MSRNFELLQTLGFDQEVLKPVAHEMPRVQAKGPVAEKRRVAPAAAADPHIASLVQRIFLGADAAANRAVALIPVSGDSTNTVCERAAEVLAAQATGSVCIVDADFSRPAVHKYFRLVNSRGFADAINGIEEVASYAHSLPDSNLTVMTAGCAGSHAFSPENMAIRLRELNDRFDYLLVRAPAASDSGTACMIGRLTGNAILVIEANETRRDAASRVKTQLQQSGVPVIGAVLNNRTYPIPQSLYSKLF